MSWIKVTDRLPEKGQIVIMYMPDVVRMGYEFDGNWYLFHNAGEMDPMVFPDVTHWQTLPEGPKD